MRFLSAIVFLAIGCGVDPCLNANYSVAGMCVIDETQENHIDPYNIELVVTAVEKTTGYNIIPVLRSNQIALWLSDYTPTSAHFYDSGGSTISVGVSAEYYLTQKALTHELIHVVEDLIIGLPYKAQRDHVDETHWLRHSCDSWEGVSWSDASGLELNCENDQLRGFY